VPGPLVPPGLPDFPEEMEEMGETAPRVTVAGQLPFLLKNLRAPDPSLLYPKGHQQEDPLKALVLFIILQNPVMRF